MNIQLKENTLTPEEFIRIRIAAGFLEVPYGQAEKALKNGLFTVSAYYEGTLAGMGRLVGDGSMYWYIQDVAVLPEYQKKGIGRAIVERLISHAKSCLDAPWASIGLTARKDKEAFYEKMGFSRLPGDVCGAGMTKRIIASEQYTEESLQKESE